jgi:hypothetical protein
MVALTKLAKDSGFSVRDAQTRAATFLMLLEGALVIQRLTNDPNTFFNSMANAKKMFFMKG